MTHHFVTILFNFLASTKMDKLKTLFKTKANASHAIPSDGLESEKDYKERWRSIYVIYFTMFLISLGFSVIVTGVWPYLDKVRKR